MVLGLCYAMRHIYHVSPIHNSAHRPMRCPVLKYAKSYAMSGIVYPGTLGMRCAMLCIAQRLLWHSLKYAMGLCNVRYSNRISAYAISVVLKYAMVLRNAPY